MFIKCIDIKNFRVYYDHCSIEFKKDSKKNIHIVSGYNGYGKTTFLTSLVWCLYGKLMKDVEDVFKQQFDDLGGYSKYVSSSLNKIAQKNGDKEFSVSITLRDVSIPSVACDEIVIRRTGYVKSGLDVLEILIDGEPNQLTKEVGDELFIQDFILPKEIAKFFFFDAEKIVQLAEMRSISDKRKLSKAYSEVLGIKKYEDLRKNLSDLRIRFRKNSAKKEDKQKFEKLSKELESKKEELLELKIKLDKADDQKIALRRHSDDLQEALIRKGSLLSVDDINNLKIEKYKTQKDIDLLKESFKGLLEFAPFAIANKLLIELGDQLEKEDSYQNSSSNQKDLKKRAKKIVRDIKSTKAISESSKSREIEKSIVEIIEKHLVEDNFKLLESNFRVLHEFSHDDSVLYDVLTSQLKSSYSNRVKELAKELRSKRLLYTKISKNLSDAESKESDGVIKKYREEKVQVDLELGNTESDISFLNQQVGSLQNEITSIEKVVSELAKKIKIRQQYVAKDQRSERLIFILNDFINKIKLEKKQSLEKKILRSLNDLMHKEGMIKNIEVAVFDDLIEIILQDESGNEIDRNTLSKGEQQLYATSILKALVEESNVEFPVFIDSPLQKFDRAHSKNIIEQFYPTVSKQVILFPLLEKEMTEKEFNILKRYIKSCHFIRNKNGVQSYFEEVSSEELFQQSQIAENV